MSESPITPTTLEKFNGSTEEDAKQRVTHWCAAPDWASQVCRARPFSSIESIANSARTLWKQASPADLMLAVSAHPVIGDVDLLRTKYSSQANKEQGQVLSASDGVLAALATQNLAYKQRHGFTFIVFATGKSAAEMLELLNERINNSTDQELKNASDEQLKIMQLRLEQSFTSST